MPLSTQSPNYRAIFKISHDPGQNFRAGTFVKKYIYKKWVLMGLYYINCSQYGNYRQIYWHENSIKKKKNLLEDACKLYASGCRESESVSANQKPGRSSLYTEQHEKHTHDFKHAEYFLSANFLWNPSSSWIEVSEPMRNKCDNHWWYIRPNNINVCWKSRVLHRYKIS